MVRCFLFFLLPLIVIVLKYPYLAFTMEANDPSCRIKNIISQCIFYHFYLMDATEFDTTLGVFQTRKDKCY